MKRLATPKVLEIETEEGLQALRVSLEMQQAFLDDTLLESVPLRVEEIKNLFAMEDDVLADYLKRIEMETFAKIDQLIAVTFLLHKLSD